MRIKYNKTCETAQLPQRVHPDDACCDLFAAWAEDLPPGETTLVRTGLVMAPDRGFWIQLESRSGMAVNGVFVVGGIIDPGYRGEIKVPLYNGSRHVHRVLVGDKIAQMAVRSHYSVMFDEVADLGTTPRGSSGFGGSGR